MNFRRYTLFLLVAILTFVIGVSAAVVVGKVNPFTHRRAVRGGCGRLTALPDHDYIDRISHGLTNCGGEEALDFADDASDFFLVGEGNHEELVALVETDHAVSK